VQTGRTEDHRRTAKPFAEKRAPVFTTGQSAIYILRSVQIARSGYSLSLVPSLRPSDPRRLASLSKETTRLSEQDRIFASSLGSHAVLEK
jgi:hypothetical protein